MARGGVRETCVCVCWDVGHVVRQLRGDGTQAKPRDPHVRGCLHLAQRDQPGGGKRNTRGNPPAHTARIAGAKEHEERDEENPKDDEATKTRSDGRNRHVRTRRREGKKKLTDVRHGGCDALTSIPNTRKCKRTGGSTTHETQPIVDVPIYGRITALELFRPKVRKRTTDRKTSMGIHPPPQDDVPIRTCPSVWDNESESKTGYTILGIRQGREGDANPTMPP